MLWFPKKRKFSVHFLYPPDTNYCCREVQSLRSLGDLLKTTSTQQWSRLKPKYATKPQLSFWLGPLHKAHTPLYLLPWVRAYKWHSLFPGKKKDALSVQGGHKWFHHQKLTHWWPNITLWIFFFLCVKGNVSQSLKKKKKKKTPKATEIPGTLWGEQNFCSFPGESLMRILRGTRACSRNSLEASRNLRFLGLQPLCLISTFLGPPMQILDFLKYMILKKNRNTEKNKLTCREITPRSLQFWIPARQCTR